MNNITNHKVIAIENKFLSEKYFVKILLWSYVCTFQNNPRFVMLPSVMIHWMTDIMCYILKVRRTEVWQKRVKKLKNLILKQMVDLTWRMCPASRRAWHPSSSGIWSSLQREKRILFSARKRDFFSFFQLNYHLLWSGLRKRRAEWSILKGGMGAALTKRKCRK